METLNTDNDAWHYMYYIGIVYVLSVVYYAWTENTIRSFSIFQIRMNQIYEILFHQKQVDPDSKSILDQYRLDPTI